MKSSSVPASISSSTRRRPRLHLLGLVLRPLDREPGVGHLLADPGRRLADPDLRLGGRVLRLDDFLLRPEGLDLRGQLLLGRRELLLLLVELLDLPVEILELLLRERLPLERGAREILATGRDRVAGLRVELDEALLQLVGLELKPLLGGHDVGDRRA